MEYHINTKELLTAKFSLKTFIKVSDAHVKLLSDNTTTVHGINNMPSNKSDLCHSIISEIWAWGEDKIIWITASCIPGKANYDADAKPPKSKPEVDLFPSGLNVQLPMFFSYYFISHTQRLCILLLFQYHGGIDPSMHFLDFL